MLHQHLLNKQCACLIFSVATVCGQQASCKCKVQLMVLVNPEYWGSVCWSSDWHMLSLVHPFESSYIKASWLETPGQPFLIILINEEVLRALHCTDPLISPRAWVIYLAMCRVTVLRTCLTIPSWKCRSTILVISIWFSSSSAWKCESVKQTSF